MSELQPGRQGVPPLEMTDEEAHESAQAASAADDGQTTSVVEADAVVAEATAQPEADDAASVQEADRALGGVEETVQAPVVEVADDDTDPVEEMKAALRRAPGEWYVIHSYAGYENKVKTNLETRVQTLDVEDFIFQVEVPVEEVTEIKNGQRKQVNRKVLPGYILVRMDLNDASWGAVRNTPGVTGFVGATSRPSPLTINDVIKFLMPAQDQKKTVGAGKGRGLRHGRVDDRGRLQRR